MNPKHLEDLLTYLRFKSVSTDSECAGDVRKCADWLVEKLNRIGLRASLHETPRHPVVIAKNEHQPGRKTVLIYGHYDVQPAAMEDGWDTEPFEPVVDEDRGMIFARGATDNKGQNLAHILGMQESLEDGGLPPLNVTILLEGEEEIGSPNLEPFLREHRDELACDVVAVSDTGMVSPGMGTLTYGLRGIACLEFKVRGPSEDLHSGVFGGAVVNPATAAARLIGSLHGADWRVAIDGFYDRVEPLADWERKAWATLPGGEEETKSITGVGILDGEKGYTELEQRWARPTAEVNGMGSGYQGEGSKTIVPREAMAKLSFRLVPDQEPDEILELAEAHLKKHCPPGVDLEIERGHAGPPYVIDPNSDYGLAAQQALRETFGGELALIREGGSIPIVQSFKDILGADTLLLGLALPDCQIHAANENFYLESFTSGIKLNRVLLKELSC
ncbi:MAG: dipeptidase [Verrucomicrobiota bacterium]